METKVLGTKQLDGWNLHCFFFRYIIIISTSGINDFVFFRLENTVPVESTSKKI